MVRVTWPDMRTCILMDNQRVLHLTKQAVRSVDTKVASKNQLEAVLCRNQLASHQTLSKKKVSFLLTLKILVKLAWTLIVKSISLENHKYCHKDSGVALQMIRVASSPSKVIVKIMIETIKRRSSELSSFRMSKTKIQVSLMTVSRKLIIWMLRKITLRCQNKVQKAFKKKMIMIRQTSIQINKVIINMKIKQNRLRIEARNQKEMI